MSCTQDPALRSLGIGIDSFASGVEFLTHAHSDHYKGLNASFNGVVYCTPATQRLLAHAVAPPCLIGVEFRRVVLGEELQLDAGETHAVRVMACAANHCEGSCMYRFTVTRHTRPGTAAAEEYTCLYTGDFRLVPGSLADATLATKVHTLYYDDTFADVRWLPSPDETADEAIRVLRRPLKPSERIFIQSSILGFEGVLRRSGLRFALSPSLPPRRVAQLCYLLEDLIDDESPYVLANMNPGNGSPVDGHGCRWIIPTCTHFRCLYGTSTDSTNPIVQEPTALHTYVWFATHPCATEIEQLISACKPSTQKSCGYKISPACTSARYRDGPKGSTTVQRG
jgi:hypothetical protein